MHGEVGHTQFLPKNILLYGTDRDGDRPSTSTTRPMPLPRPPIPRPRLDPRRRLPAGRAEFRRHPGLERSRGLPEGDRHHRQADRRRLTGHTAPLTAVDGAAKGLDSAIGSCHDGGETEQPTRHAHLHSAARCALLRRIGASHSRAAASRAWPAGHRSRRAGALARLPADAPRQGGLGRHLHAPVPRRPAPAADQHPGRARRGRNRPRSRSRRLRPATCHRRIRARVSCSRS